MMYALYNSDGSIKKINLTEVVSQGSNGVNSLFVAIAGVDNSINTATAYFTLPDGSVTALVGVATNDQEIDGVEYNGYLFTLSQNETKYSGVIYISIQIINNSTLNILRTLRFPITVNKTNADLDETLITLAQYNAILTLINSGLANKLDVINTDGSVVMNDLPAAPFVIFDNSSERYYFIIGKGTRSLYGYMFNESCEGMQGTISWTNDTDTLGDCTLTFSNLYGSTPTQNDEYATKGYIDNNKGTKLYRHIVSGFTRNGDSYKIVGYNFSGDPLTNSEVIYRLPSMSPCFRIYYNGGGVSTDIYFTASYHTNGAPTMSVGMTFELTYTDYTGTNQVITLTCGTITDEVTEM